MLHIRKNLSSILIASRVFTSDYTYEDNQTKGEIVLNAFDRDISYSNLVDLEEKVKNKFRNYKIISNDVAIRLNYLGGNVDEQDDELLKKIEIRLDFNYFERS